MSLNLRTISGGTPLTQSQLDGNFTFLYGRDITGSTVTGTTLFLYKQDGTFLETQLPSNSGGTGVDTFTTGFTFTNNNTLTISRNQGLSNLPVTINNLTLTGLTVNGSLSASTYLGLPQFVTGGIYSAGTLSLLTNGNVVNVTGFSKTINVETIEWQDDQTVDYTKKAGIDDPVIFFDSSNNSFDSPSSITVTLDPNLSYTSSDVGKRNWKMIFPNIQRVEDGNTWIVKQGGSGVTSVNLVEYKAGRVTPHVLEFWWDPNFSGGRYRIAKYELEEAENDGTTVDPAIGLNFYSKIKFAGQIWGGGTGYGNSGGSTIIPAGAIIYVKDVIILNQGTITPTGATIAIGLSTVDNGGSLGSSLTTSSSLSDFGVPSNDSLAIFKNSRPASYYNSGSGGVGNANMFFVDNTIGAVRTSVPVMITLSTTSTLTDGVIQVYVPYMVIQPRLSGTPYTLIDNTYDLWVTESNWSALNSGGTSTATTFTGNTSASCITDLYVSNLFGCSPITIHDSIQNFGSSATGITSFAFGNTAVATGDYSHAEGEFTQSIGTSSHAEGLSTITTGTGSHAEGNGSTTTGQYSHAEGDSTKSIGDYSHAEGSGTYSGAYAYLVSGYSGNNIVLNPSYGNVTSEFTSTTTVFVYNYSGVQGEVLNFSATSYDSITSATTVVVTVIGSVTPNYILPNPRETGIYNPLNADQILGNYSHAEGYGTQAIGNYSHAEGDSTQAIGGYSHAEGNTTQSIGQYSHAEGEFTQSIGTSSHAEGNTTQSIGTGSHSQGILTTSSGDYSFASGSASTASGIASFIHSSNSTVSGNRSVVLGGQGISGTSNDFVYVSNLNINNQPTLNNSGTQILTRNSSTGNVEYRDFSTISGGTGVDTFTTGFTFTNNNTLTISRNQGLSNLPVTINNLTLTGLTVNGSISATTYLNLPPFTGNTSASCITDLYVSNIYGCSPITIHDSIQSVGSSATGITSFAFGDNTKAFGTYSHAEGVDTISSGSWAHAEGRLSIASNTGSHAEGSSTVSSGLYSHAEGLGTSATTTGAHSQGVKTLASGQYSFASGSETQSIGYSSHAEGSGTTASGIGSHAEGFSTIASGNYSHAEGNYTQAFGQYSHSEGISTSATTTGSHAEGSGTTASGIGSHAEGSGTMASGTTSHSEGLLTSAIGYASHAEGYNTQAIGDYSHAEGLLTRAIGNYSHAEGYFVADVYGNTYFNKAIGIGSHAEGGGTMATGTTSHSEGLLTQAIGTNSHAEGSRTQAIGTNSHAEGIATKAIGYASHAEGGATTAIGTGSHAEGSSTQAIGDYSHAEGSGTYSGAYAYLVSGTSGNDIVLNPSYGDVTSEFTSTTTVFVYDSSGVGGEVLNFSATSYDSITSATTVVVNNIGLITPVFILPNPNETGTYNPLNADQILGTYSHAEGVNTQTIGIYSHAEGGYTQAIGYFSHAEGLGSQSIGNYSHAEGRTTQALGDYSHAEGDTTQAIGIYSHSQGILTRSNGDYSHASGSGSTAQGISSFIHSSNSIVTGDRSVVLGGQGISGTSSDFVYVSNLNINSIPVSNSGETQVLVRNSSTGDIEYNSNIQTQIDALKVEEVNLQDIGAGLPASTYTIVLNAKYTRTINELTVIAGAGTCTLTMNINGTPVTGISGVSVTTTGTTYTATATNVVVVGDTVTMVTTSNSGLANLQATIKTTR